MENFHYFSHLLPSILHLDVILTFKVKFQPIYTHVHVISSSKMFCTLLCVHMGVGGDCHFEVRLLRTECNCYTIKTSRQIIIIVIHCRRIRYRIYLLAKMLIQIISCIEYHYAVVCASGYVYKWCHCICFVISLLNKICLN